MDTLAGASRTTVGAFLGRARGRTVRALLTACLVFGLAAPVCAGAETPAAGEAGPTAAAVPAASPGPFQGFASPSEVPEWAKGKPIQFHLPPERPQVWEKAPPESVEDGLGRGPAPASADTASSASTLAVIPPSEREHSKLPYNGGLVQEGEIHVYLTFWGSGWNQHAADKEHIIEMFRFLNNSPYTGILTQYFDHTGHPSGGVSLSSYTDGSIVTPETVSQTKIELEAKKSIETQGWPPASFDNTYVVLPAPGATEQLGFNTGCARHGFDSEIGSPFVFVWYPTSTEHTACLEGHQPWEAMQATAAFEFAQAATDPQPYNTFGSTLQSGWNRPTGEVRQGGEVASEEVGELCGAAAGGIVEEAPGIWLPRIRDNYLLAEQGIACAAQDKEPVRYTLSLGATQIPEPHQATVTGTVIPGGWPAHYRFNVSDPATGYSAIVPAEFQPVAATKTGEVVSAKLPTVAGGQNYSVTLESYSALTEPDPPLSTSTSVLTTSGSFGTPVWTPEVALAAPAPLSSTSEKLSGSVNPRGLSTTYQFEYGTTTAYGKRTSLGQAGSGVSPVAVGPTLTGLSPATIYHYRLVATNSEGTTYGGDTTFETLPPPPAATTATPSGVQLTGATASGSVNPEGAATTYYFEYGPSPSFGLKSATGSAGSGKEAVPVSQTLSGLEFGREYSVRLVATNAGGTSYGATQHFTPGGWRNATNSSVSPEARLVGVACPTATRCFAVGGYKSSGARPRIAAWNGSAWSDVGVPYPEGFKEGELTSISCGGASSCVAVGKMSGGFGEEAVPLVELWNGSSWSYSLLAKQTKGRSFSQLSVSCTSSSSCLIVGNNTLSLYEPYVRETTPYIARWNGVSWATQAPPAVQSEFPWLVFTDVSCTSSTTCLATASEGPGNPDRYSIWSMSGSTWTRHALPIPAGYGEPPAVDTISCSSSTSCVAAGSLYTWGVFSGGRTYPYAVEWNGTSLIGAKALPMPPGAVTAEIEAVSCPSSSSCEAVGDTYPEHYYEGPHIFAVGYTAGSWAEQAIPAPPGSVKANAYGITCIAAGDCKAVGNGAAHSEEYGMPLVLTDEWKTPKP